MSSDLTPARLRALANEYLMLDLQASMTEAEMARYDRLPLLMAQALKGFADWRADLESEIAGDVECTREQLCMAVDAGADQADINRLNRAVWTLFERASALRLVFRRINPIVARVIELDDVIAERDAALARAEKAEALNKEAGKEAAFLLARLQEFEGVGDMSEESAREWGGHVEPSLARLRILAAKLKGEG